MGPSFRSGGFSVLGPTKPIMLREVANEQQLSQNPLFSRKNPHIGHWNEVCKASMTATEDNERSSEPAEVVEFDGILLDMDGTIIDSTDAIVKYWQL